MSDDKDDKNKNKYIIPLKNKTVQPPAPPSDSACSCPDDGEYVDILEKVTVRLASNGGYVADLRFAMGSPDDTFIFPTKEELMTFLADIF